MIAGRGSEAGKLILLGNCPARPDRSALFVHGSAVESSRAVGLTERSPSAHTSGGLPGWLSWFVSLFSGSGHDGGHVTAPKSSDPCVPAQIALGAGLSSSPRPGVQTTAPVEGSDGHRAYTATSANAVELQGGTAAASECRTEAGTAAVKLTSSLSLAGTTLNISNVIAAGGGNVIAAGGGN